MHRIFLALLLTLSASAADLGSVAFPTSSTNAEAQAAFERGVAALHSFWYEEAADSFRKARTLDPSFAMAYWGEAVSHNHPIWMEQDRTSAREVLAAMPKDAGNAREREWLATLDVLYGDGDKHARDLAYEQALRALAQKYPDDLEAQAFHALSILGAMARGNDPRRQVAAAAVLEPLLVQAPEHPGVLHYMIHAYDDPLHAPLGLRAARRYARVAPAAHHALHMPSHIFLQLGMWDEAAASNEQAYAASKAWVERAKLPSSKRDLHSLTWLHYIYLQQGRRDEALRLLQEVETPLSERERSTRARMLATWAVETGEAVEETSGSKEEEGSHCAAGSTSASDAALYARALTAIRRKEFGRAESAIAALKGNTTSEVMALVLKAMLEQKRGRLSKAIQLAEQAVAKESTLGAPFGPPDVLKPAHELYGELLSAAGRCDEAREQFGLSLLRTPNRRLSANPPPCRE